MALLSCLLVLIVMPAIPDNVVPLDPEIPDLSRPDVDPYGFQNVCPEVDPAAEPLNYRVLPLQIQFGAGIESPIDPDEPPVKYAAVNISEGMQIESEPQFAQIFPDTPSDVNWETERVLVVEEFASYKFNSLDSDVRLTGVYRTAESIIIYQTSTNYGPCQGIAQDPSWFSFESTYLLLVLPREPSRIDFLWCSVGGCPPDIP